MSAYCSPSHGHKPGKVLLLVLLCLLMAARIPLPRVNAQELTPTAVILGNELDESGALYHIVQPGESLDLIARMNGVDAFSILSLNGLPNDVMLHPGDRLLIRMPEPPTALPSATPIPESELAKTPSITPSPTNTVQPLGEQVLDRVTIPSMLIVGGLLLVVIGGFAVAAWAGKQKPY